MCVPEDRDLFLAGYRQLHGEGGPGFPPVRPRPGIAVVYREPRQRRQQPAQRLQRGMARDQQRVQPGEVVRPRDDGPAFVEQPFQELLGGLPTVKTDDVMVGGLKGEQSPGASQVGLGLAQPFAGHGRHTGRFPSR